MCSAPTSARLYVANSTLLQAGALMFEIKCEVLFGEPLDNVFCVTVL